MAAPPLPSPPLPPPGAFVNYSAQHALTVAVCVALIAALAATGRTIRGKDAERHMRTGLAIGAIGFWLFYSLWWNWRTLDVYNGLPLHVCDIGGLIAPLALLTLNRWLRATLYFWAFALTLQGFIQPVVKVGPAYLEFWGFWAAHTIIIGCAVYDLIALGFRPTIRDFWRALIISIAYLAVIIPVDLLLEANYGYVGNPPGDKPIPEFVRALGPWPWRIGLMAVLGILAFLVVGAPFFHQQALARSGKTGSRPAR